ncbi:MAG: ORF6N domain-containing protein [Candidatus Pacebacteria bacterium]|nr:ORF6N domain-containing protein [Candidatus Paceibacterota bacterium]
MKKAVTKQKTSLIPVETIERKIFVIRGMKVMIDADIAEFYGVTTKVLNQAVKRNKERFPSDFIFQLTSEEVELLNRSQIVTGSQKHRDPRFMPYAFTEHGVMMLSSVLKSDRAVEMGIFIVRAFIKLREVLATHKDLANKFNEMVRVQVVQGSKIESIQKLLLRLTTEAVQPKERIGFR